MHFISKSLIAATALTSTLFTATQTQATPILLFRDTFAGTNETDLNLNQAGQSGDVGNQNWIESSNGSYLADGDAQVDSVGHLSLFKVAGDGNGNRGCMIYLDHNFVGLTSMAVEIRVLNGNSGGDGRGFGFSLGQSKAELDAQTSATPSQAPGDLSVSFDNVGNTTGLSIRENGAQQTFINSGSLTDFGYPDYIRAELNFADMNAGTTVNYEIFFNDVSAYTGSTTWSGTNENYVSLQSNYTNYARTQYVDIQGEVVPEPTSLALLGLGGLLFARRRRG